MKDVSTIIAQAKKAGAKFTPSVVIRRASISNATPGNERVTLILNTAVPDYIEQNGEYVEKLLKVINVRTFGVTSALQECEESDIIIDVLKQSLLHYRKALRHATCDILSFPVKEDTDFINPFSDDPKPYHVQHDDYFHFLVNLRLGNKATDYIYRMDEADEEAAVEATKAKSLREFESTDKSNVFNNRLRSIVNGTSEATDDTDDDATE